MTRMVRVVDPGSQSMNPQVCNDDIGQVEASHRFWGIRDRVYQVANPDNIELVKMLWLRSIYLLEEPYFPRP